MARRSDLLRRTRVGLLSVSAALWTRSPDAIPPALAITGLKSRRPSPDAYGLPSGELLHGALVMALLDIPKSSEFGLRSYSNQPGGKPYEAGGKYPPGFGAPQWELLVDVKAVLIEIVLPGNKYQG